jgi:hypothetical protein
LPSESLDKQNINNLASYAPPLTHKVHVVSRIYK